MSNDQRENNVRETGMEANGRKQVRARVNQESEACKAKLENGVSKFSRLGELPSDMSSLKASKVKGAAV